MTEQELIEQIADAIQWWGGVGSTRRYALKGADQIIQLVREHDAKFIDAEKASRILIGMKPLIRQQALDEAIAAVESKKRLLPNPNGASYDITLADAIEALQQLRDSHEH